jgi:hypothetical protein
MESQDNRPNAELEKDLEAETPGGAPPPPEEPGYAPPPSSKRSVTPLIVGIAVAVVILCGICLVGVILWKTGVLPIFAPERAAPKIMPADMTFFVSIDMDIEDRAGYKHLAEVYGDIPEVEDAMDDFLGQMEDELGMSYEDDIKPWLGPELAVGIASLQNALIGGEPVVIIAAGTRDKKASDVFLEEMLEYLEAAGYDIGDEVYQKVDYYVAEPENEWETPLILGTVKRFVILTMDEDAMQDVIDAAKGKSDSLADNERYTKLVGALPGGAVACAFFNIGDLIEVGLQGFEEGLETPGLDLPSKTTDQLEAFQAVGLALDLTREGIQFDFAATFDPDALSPEMLDSLQAKASANRILKRVPDDALGFLSGQNLAAVWKSALASLKEAPDVEQQLGDFGDQMGLDLDEELLNWLPGEYAVALLEAKGVADVPAGGFAVFEIDDREEAEDALEDILGAVKEFAYLEFNEQDIGGVEMQVVVDPDSEGVILGYGFTDKHLVIGFTEDALAAAAGDDIGPIVADETFKKVQKHLPSKTGGYLYVNVEAALRLAYKNMPDMERKEFDESARPFLEPIKAMGVAAPPADAKKGVSLGTLFLYIPGE